MTITHKRCSKCGNVKPMDEFRVDLCTTDGRKTQCKECMNEADRARHAKRIAAGIKIDRKRKTSEREPPWPVPTYTIQDSLACVKLRKWRGPVNHEPMRARL